MKKSTEFMIWEKVQNYISEKLKHLYSDSVVLNPSNVLRLPNTINSKCGKIVRTYLLRKDRLTLKYFQDKYIPDFVPEKINKKEKSDSILKKKSTILKKNLKVEKIKHKSDFCVISLHSARVNDYFRIVEWKIKNNENIIGIRSKLALLIRYSELVSNNGDSKAGIKQVERLWAILEKDASTCKENSLKELLARSQNAEEYYDAWKTDNIKEGFIHSGLVYTNKKIIDDLLVPIELQIQLETIKNRFLKGENGIREINKEYERARKNNFNRSKNIIARNEYLLGKQHETENRVSQLRVIIIDNPNIKGREIADLLNITPARVSQLIKLIKINPHD